MEGFVAPEIVLLRVPAHDGRFESVLFGAPRLIAQEIRDGSRQER